MIRRSGTPGFTLLELLVSLGLLALLSLLLVDGLRFGARVWERSGSTAGSSGDLSVTYDFLSRRMRSAVFAIGEDQTGREVPSVIGDSLSFSFLSSDPDNPALSSRHRLTIDCSGAASTGDCIASVSASDGRSLPWVNDSQSRTTILADVSKMEIDYFGSDAANAAPSRHKDWSAARHVPELIRLRFNQARENSYEWVFALPPIQ